MAKAPYRIEDIIRKTPPFCGCSNDTLGVLVSAPRGHFCAGEIIHSPSSTQKKLIILLSGTAEVYSAHTQKKTLLRVLGQGDSVGIANLYSEGPFVSIITAVRPCETLEIHRDMLDDILKDDGAVMRDFLALLSDKICYLNKRIQCYTAGSVESRLAMYLYNASTPQNSSLTVSAVLLSEMLDVGRASLYRALDRLEEDGLIVRCSKTICIKDRENLLSYCER